MTVILNEQEAVEPSQETRYSPLAQNLIRELDRRVEEVVSQIHQEPVWSTLFSEDTPNELVADILREVFLGVYWYQKHTTEAGIAMLGRLPKHETRLLRSLLAHKVEEAEHGEWALRDYLMLGGQESLAMQSPSPATFAVAGVWWRMAVVEDPFGYLGAEYLFEYLTARVAPPVMLELQRRGFDVSRVGFIEEHATEDIRHANLIRHWIGDCVTRYPTSAESMQRCFDYFSQVYPLPVWREAFERALGTC